MKVVLLALVVVVLMAGSGFAGYYFGDQSGFTRAQTIRNDFFQQRFGNNAQSGQTDQQAQGGGQRGQGGQGGQGANAFGRPVASGTVKSVDGNKVTITQQDGSTQTVTVDAKATIQKTGSGTIADIKAGERITVLEQTTNGATTQRIQLTSAQ